MDSDDRGPLLGLFTLFLLGALCIGFAVGNIYTETKIVRAIRDKGVYSTGPAERIIGRVERATFPDEGGTSSK